MNCSCISLQIFCLDWNCSGSYLASGSQDQLIKLWKIGTKSVSVSCTIGLLFESLNVISFCSESHDLSSGSSRGKKGPNVSLFFSSYRFLWNPS